MIAPEEKAKELVHKYDLMQTYIEEFSIEESKQCALIAVDEIIEQLEELLEGDERPSAGVYYLWEYHKEVKQEIEKL